MRATTEQHTAQASRLDRRIWAIAGPAILSNISAPLVGIADAAILGHLDSAAFLAAVAVGSAVLSFLYWGFGFLRMGTTGLVARALGAADATGAQLALGRAAVLALLLALLVWLLHPLWLHAALQLMAPADGVAPLATEYVQLRVLSAPAVLLSYAVVGWCIGRQDTRTPLLITLVTQLLNLLLDLVLILGLGMASAGAALATCCAEYAGAVVALLAVRHQLGGRAAPGVWQGLRTLSGYAPLLRSNAHLFVRTVCLLGAFAFFTAMGSRLGSEVVAANALFLQLLMLSAYALDGFAYAAEGLAGHCAGAGDSEGLGRVAERCALWCLLGSALFALLFACAGPLLPLLTGLPGVLALLQAYLPWLVLLPLVAAPSYLLDGVFIGAAATRELMLGMLASVLLVYLPAWWLSRDLGNDGLWLAFLLFSGARSLSLYPLYRYRQGRRGWQP